MKVIGRVLLVLVLVAAVAGAVFYCQPLRVQDAMTRFRLWRHGVRSEYIEVGGYRLHYFEAPAAAGSANTPLLLIHGLGARGEDWAPLIPPLAAAGFHVYAPDLPGYGRSSKPDASYSIAMEEAAVVSFMQTVHLARADVGGWSMGGWITLKLALDHPELVNRVVVYDSAGTYFPATWEPDLFSPTDVAGVHRLLAALSPKSISMPDFAARAVVRKLQANKWVIQRSLMSMIDGRDLLDFRLHNITEPTLVVWGAHDDLIPLSAGRKMHDSIPHSSMDVMEGCGHLAPAECAKPVIEGTIQFLRADPPIEGVERTFPMSAAK